MARIAIFLFCFAIVFSSTAQDIDLAKSYELKGRGLADKSHYDSALYYFELAIDIYEEADSLMLAYAAKVHAAYVKQFLGDFQASYDELTEYIAWLKANRGPNDSILPTAYYNYAEYWHEAKGNLDSARYYSEESVRLFLEAEGEESTGAVKSLTQQSWIMRLQGQLDSAMVIANKTLALSEDHHLEDTLIMMQSLNRVAVFNAIAGNLDVSTGYFKRILDFGLGYFGDSHNRIAALYNNLGNLYYLRGNIATSAEYYQNSIDIRHRIFGEGAPQLASPHMNLAVNYGSQGLHHLAISNYKRSLNIQEQFNVVRVDRIECYRGLATHYSMLGEFDSAKVYLDRGLDFVANVTDHGLSTIYDAKGQYNELIKNYDEAISGFLAEKEILEQRFPDGNHALANTYASLGRVYQAKGLNDLSRDYLRRGLQMQIEQNGSKHFEVAQILNVVGAYFSKLEQYDSAASYHHRSVVANIIDFDEVSTDENPSDFSKVLNRGIMLSSLKQKAIALEALYNQRGDTSALNDALHTYEVSEKFLSEFRRADRTFKERLEMAELGVSIYKGLVRVNFMLYELTNDSEFAKRAFHYSEQSKSLTLLESVSDRFAKQYSNIPDSTLEREKNLLLDLGYYQSTLTSERSKKAPSRERILQFEEKLFNGNEEYKRFVNELEINYPDYFSLKYGGAILETDDIATKLGDQQVLVEYFEGDSSYYVFVLTQSEYQLSKIAKSNDLNKTITDFRVSLSDSLVSKDASAAEALFNANARKLYEMILEPVSNLISNASRVTIIPDGALGYIPFEVLPMEADNPKSYLLSSLIVNYAYSASILFAPNRSKPAGKGYIGFAPSYSNPENDVSLGRFRSVVGELLYNKQEVQEIIEEVGGDAYLGDDATERRFKEMAGTYSIIHLAMHALVDDDDPMNSKLLFTQNKDSLEDSYLHTYELFNQSFNADLVVLSACNTGVGKMIKGEGIMSLARAFAYSGCPSMVMSHWAVDDEATKDLMKLFYGYLNDGKAKGEAMRLAKLEYLSKAHPTRTFPFYWASFVVIGDDSPIITPTNWWFISAGGLVLLLVVVITIMRRRKTVA